MKLYQNHKLLTWLLVFSTLVAVFFAPFNFVIAPERRLQFLDKQGRPIVDALIRQNWDQYSLDEHRGVLLKTDSEGRVILPKREIKTSIIDLIRGAIKQNQQLGIHAGYFSSEYVSIRVNEKVGKQFYAGKGLESGKVIIDTTEVNNERTKTN